MSDGPELYGIRKSNLTSGEMMTREMFPVAFSVALVNYMGARGINLNKVSIDSGLRCGVTEVPLSEVYGCAPTEVTDAEFCFGSVYDPYLELASEVPKTGLVLRDGRGNPLGRTEIRTSVIPDTTTRGLSDDMMGSGPGKLGRAGIQVPCLPETVPDSGRLENSFRGAVSGG